MPSYFILSKSDFAGISGNDSGNMQHYTELGWELAIFRIHFNELVRKKIFNVDSDFVVTNHDRAFLYTKYCKNVISYDEYVKIKNHADDNVFNIISLYGGEDPTDTIFSHRMISYTQSVKNNIYNTMLDLPDINSVLKNDNKFIAISIRKRDHCPERTPDQSKIDKMIDICVEKGMSVYVMGKGCEYYENGTNVFHVNLPQLASLLNSSLCERFISPVSGGGMIRFYTGTCKFSVIDKANESNNHVLLFGGDVDRTGTLNKQIFKIVHDEDRIINGLQKR
jgi:hypothetical protein